MVGRKHSYSMSNETGTGQLFNRIASSYDCVNRLLSLRRDIVWRKRLANFLPEGQGLRVLDVGTGTGDALLALAAVKDRLSLCVGVDIAPRMLEKARAKFATVHHGGRLRFVQADAQHLTFAPASFDAALIAFGIRNVPDMRRALLEIRRVLRVGGRLLILEFSTPRCTAIRFLYLIYLRYIVPLVGGVISGDFPAYRYLQKSVERFPHGAAFCRILETAGFQNVAALPLTCGIVTLYQADK